MTAVFALGVLSAVLTLAGIGELLRRRQLREKYAVLWLLVGPAIAVLAVVPSLLDAAADALGVADPVNLLLFLGVLVLLGVCLHLSWECSRLEEETRDLVEALALLRHRVDRLERP